MIPDEEAVQRVHAAICEESLADCLDPDWRGRCVKAVEAAAPHIQAQALRDAADDYSVNLTVMSGPRIREWLKARADQINPEAKEPR